MLGQLSEVEKILEQQFQKKVCLSIKNEVLKEGQFILFRSLLWHNNYYLELHIKTQKKIDLLKIPYPFKIEDHTKENLLLFDYRLCSLTNNDNIKKLISKYKPTDSMGLNKFYDSILEISLL